MRLPPGPATEGSRLRRKRATREKLIRAGRRLFGERGLFESRIEDLSLSAGIAKGTLYTYFEDKDALIRAVVDAGLQELSGKVERRIGSATEFEAVAARVVAAHVAFFAANPELVRIFNQARGMLKFDRADWRPLKALLTNYLDSLARMLARSPRFAALPRRERLAVTRLAYGAITGVTSLEAALAGGRPPRALTRDTIGAVTAMLVARVANAEARPRRTAR